MKGQRILWTARQLSFIKRRRKWPRQDLHAAFVRKFRRREISLGALCSLCKRSGWLTGPRAGRGKGQSTLFSGLELTFVKRRRKMDRHKLYAAFVRAFGRNDVTFEQLHALCKRRGWRTGRTGRFEKGSAPWSKGKKLGNNPGSARTQFRKGQLPRNTKYAGHERVATHGYIEISVEQTNPHTGFERRYVIKHRWLWEQMHGPIPEGMVLKCKGDHLNTDPSNWELVPRGLLPRLNGRASRGRNYDDAPSELKPTIMAVAKLEHQVRGRARKTSPAPVESVHNG